MAIRAQQGRVMGLNWGGESGMGSWMGLPGGSMGWRMHAEQRRLRVALWNNQALTEGKN